MKHQIKIWPQHFSRLLEGTKTFEIRNNDRGYQKGDSVQLEEWSPEDGNYTGNSIFFYVGDVYFIDNERVVFSLLKENLTPPQKESE